MNKPLTWNSTFKSTDVALPVCEAPFPRRYLILCLSPCGKRWITKVRIEHKDGRVTTYYKKKK